MRLDLKRARIRLAGYSEDGKPIFNGADVFQLTDTYGLPLQVTVEALRGQGGFDVAGFVAAARESGNYSDTKLRVLLASCGLPDSLMETAMK